MRFLKGREWGRRAGHGLLAFLGEVIFSLLPIYQQLFLFVNVPQQQVHCNSTIQIWSVEVFKFFYLELGDFGWALLGQETQILILRCPFWHSLLLSEKQISTGRAPGSSTFGSSAAKVHCMLSNNLFQRNYIILLLKVTGNDLTLLFLATFQLTVKSTADCLVTRQIKMERHSGLAQFKN